MGVRSENAFFKERQNDMLWRNNPETHDLTPTFQYCPLISSIFALVKIMEQGV